MSACIGQPLSWLVLERHALVELEGAAAAVADEHLAQCAACRAARQRIAADARVLPPLPQVETRIPWWRTSWTWGGGGVLIAAAALLLLLLRVRKPDDMDPRAVRVKGAGVVVMGLVRERGGAVTFDPPDVRDGDRWKVQVTCGPGGAAWVEVVVYQAGAPPMFPLAPARVGCGNSVVVPGAFRITGGAATVCARITPDAPARRATLPLTPMACMSLRL